MPNNKATLALLLAACHERAFPIGLSQECVFFILRPARFGSDVRPFAVYLVAVVEP